MSAKSDKDTSIEVIDSLTDDNYCSDLNPIITQVQDDASLTMTSSRRSSTETVSTVFSAESTHTRATTPDATDCVQQVLSKDLAPFAMVNELRQKNAIDNLVVVESTKIGENWLAEITFTVVQTKVMCHGRGQAARKSDAKALAASRCIDQLQAGCLEDFSESLAIFEIARALRNEKTCSTKQLQAMDTDRQHLRQVRFLKSQRLEPLPVALCVSIDVEMYEQDHDIPLEIGLAVQRSDSIGIAPILTHHLIVEDYLHLHNGIYCADNRDQLRPEFGSSESVSRAQLTCRIDQILSKEIIGIDRVYWVGHSIQGDMKWLKSMGVDLDKFHGEMVDIARAYRAMRYPGEYHNMVGMKQMLMDLGLSSVGLHNAGNDSVYNLMVLTALLELSTTSNDDCLSNEFDTA